MKHRFSVSEAAGLAGMTSETLRHYDRIGLVLPHEKDPWTGYRYYTEQEIVRLNTIQSLQLMDLSLKEIKEVLEYDQLDKVIAFLRFTEQKADEKIAQLRNAKSKIKRARLDYEKKRRELQPGGEVLIRQLPERLILLSDSLQEPTVDNLWHYHDHFYGQIEASLRGEYAFEDQAGIYTRADDSRLFAICSRYPRRERLTVLPGGFYLCANCSQETREAALSELRKTAWEQHHVKPPFAVQLVIVSGILQWNYQIQLLLTKD